MKIGETRRLKKVVAGVRVLPVTQEEGCNCKWEDDNGEEVTLTLSATCKIHKPSPLNPPIVPGYKSFA